MTATVKTAAEFVRMTIDAMVKVREQNKEQGFTGDKLEVKLTLTNEEICAMLGRQRLKANLRNRITAGFRDSDFVQLVSVGTTVIELKTVPMTGQRNNFSSLQELLKLV